jgi:hypothetical protein
MVSVPWTPPVRPRIHPEIHPNSTLPETLNLSGPYWECAQYCVMWFTIESSPGK